MHNYTSKKLYYIERENADLKKKLLTRLFARIYGLESDWDGHRYTLSLLY